MRTSNRIVFQDYNRVSLMLDTALNTYTKEFPIIVMNGTTMITFDVFNNRCVIDGELGTYVSCNGLI